jgi:hypothetical protein
VAGDTWQQLLGNLARGIVELFTNRANLLPLALRFGDPTPFLPALERLLAAMRRDGFTAEQALTAFHMVVSFSVGVVMFMNSLRTPGISSTTRIRMLLAQMPAELAPSTPALPEALVESRALLDAGLALLIAGLERERTAVI